MLYFRVVRNLFRRIKIMLKQQKNKNNRFENKKNHEITESSTNDEK